MKSEYGLQLYSVRDYAEKSYRDMVLSVAYLGYRTIETAGFFGLSAEEVRAIIDEAGVKLIGTHSSLNDLTEDKIGETIKYHNAIGNKRYIVPGFDHSSREKLDAAIAVFNYAYPILGEAGISLLFHNHSSEFLTTYDGKTVMEILMESTPIDFEIDTYWSWNAGVDNMTYLRENASRIPMIHLKDGALGGEGFALGEGDVPLTDIIALARELNMDIVVESETLKPTGIEEVTRCADYLKSLEK